MRKNSVHGSTGNIINLLFILLASLLLFPGCEKDNFNDIINRESVIGNLPVPGNEGNILVSGIQSDRVTLSWESARDDSTPAGELLYMVVSSSLNNLKDADSAGMYGTIALSWTAGSSTHTVSGLSPGEIFYFNVLVKDGDGYISAYTGVSAMTAVSGTAAADTIYMVSAGGYKGDLGGRFGADLICRNYISNNYPSLPVSHMRAFISIDAVDQIVDFPTIFGVPELAAIKSPTGAVIANNWADLMDGSIVMDLFSAGVLSFSDDKWWSGSNIDGSVAVDTCSGFTYGDTSSQSGVCGSSNASDGYWINNDFGPCSGNRFLLCIGW